MHRLQSFLRFLGFSLSLVGTLAVCSLGCSKDGDDPKTDDQSDFNLDPNRKITVDLSWDSKPIAESFLKAKLKFIASDQSNIMKVSLSKFKPWMPSMGHGTYVDKQKIVVSPESPSIVTVENVYFTMGGPWEIEISASLGSTSSLDSKSTKDSIPFETKISLEVAPPQ